MHTVTLISGKPTVWNEQSRNSDVPAYCYVLNASLPMFEHGLGS